MSGGNFMEWLMRLNRAIQYIEGNLTSEVNVNVAAREAASSVFHFQRSFMMLTGVTVAEYVRRRRLTLAAQELASSDGIKVIDVALKYGYETPESFTKAFSRLHGLPPSQVKQKGVSLKAYPPITFTLSIKGAVSMNYRIVEREGFKLAGKSLKVTTVDGENFKAIPSFWTQCNKDGTSHKICGVNPEKPMLGVCMNDYDKDMKNFTYVIAAEADGKDAQGLEIFDVPASTWAVFESRGPMPTAIQEVWNRIYQEWFPATGYEHAGLPELEVYPEGDTSSKDYYCEVWIPVKKNKA
jgi:AraC family transcriptional regulator